MIKGQNILGLFAVCAAIMLLAITFYAGAFTVSFGANLCYSEVIASIRDRVKDANASGNPDEYRKLEEFLNSLPLQGYESSCDEIRSAIGAGR